MTARQIPGGAYVDGTTSRQIPGGPYILESSGSDVTAPLLTGPTGTQTGSTTASGTIITNEGNGTLYSLASVNATETAAAVKSSGNTQAVSSSGTKSVTFTGLTASTPYHAHYVHRDAAGNDSLVASSASFTTAAAGATAPVQTGTLTPSAITSNSYTLTWPAATDAVGVTGYEISLDDGTTYSAVGVTLTTNVTGRTPGATDATRVRAFNAAGLRSSPALSANVTLLAAAGGTLTSPAPLKNISAAPQASITGILAKIFDSAGALVVSKTVASDGSGLVVMSDALIVAGSTYYVALIHIGSGAFGIFKAVAT